MAFDIDHLEHLLQAAAAEGRRVSYSELLLAIGQRFTRPRMRALCAVLDEIDNRAAAAGQTWNRGGGANATGCPAKAGGWRAVIMPAPGKAPKRANISTRCSAWPSPFGRRGRPEAEPPAALALA